jgi:anti-anti-sigma factor
MSAAPHVSNSPPGESTSATPEFTCTWRRGGSAAAWVHAAGELDLTTAPQLTTTLRDARRHALLVVLDARELIFLDSAGVRAILDATDDVQHNGGLLLIATSPLVDHALVVTGASKHVSTFDLISS